jgi:hypothetical protein
MKFWSIFKRKTVRSKQVQVQVNINIEQVENTKTYAYAIVYMDELNADDLYLLSQAIRYSSKHVKVDTCDQRIEDMCIQNCRALCEVQKGNIFVFSSQYHDETLYVSNIIYGLNIGIRVCGLVPIV